MTERQSDDYYRDLERRLRSLVPLVASLLTPEVVKWYSDYLDAGEYGLAVEVAAEALPQDASPDLRKLASALLSEAGLMELGGASIDRLRALTGRAP